MGTWKWYGLALKDQYGATAADRVDYASDTIKIALLGSGYTPDQDAHRYWSDVSASEITGTGYTAGGQALASKTLTYDAATNEARLDAADPSWTSATFTYRYAVVYKDTGTPSTSHLLAYLDTGGNQSVSSGTASITFDAAGILKITAA